MFGEKFQKELLKMFPLEEQQGEEQSANPSFKHTSNEDEEDDDGRVTPYYKGCEEDRPLQRYQTPSENQDHQLDFSLQNDCEGENQYQKMRQNPDINYESFFNRKMNFDCKENFKSNPTKQIIIVNPPIQQKGFDLSNLNSSFQNLMDSNFNKDDCAEEKKSEIKNQQNFQVQTNKEQQSSQIYPEVTVNGQPLTNKMLMDSEIRWRLMFELLSLEKAQISTESSEFPKLFQKLETRHNEEKQKFRSVEKTVERKVDQVQQIIEKSLQAQVQKRQKKEFLALHKYEQMKHSVFEKFREKSQESIDSLDESIGKRIQKKNLQLMRAKRVLSHSVQQQVNQQTMEYQKIELQMRELIKSQNQSLQKIESEVEQKFAKISEEITSARKQIKMKEYMIKEGLEKLGGRVTGYLNKQIAEGKQIEEELTKLLLGLIDKLG